MLPAWSLPPGFAQHWPLRQSYQLARCAGLFQPLHCYTEHDHPPARRPLTSLKAVNTFKGLEAQAVLARDRQQQHFLSGEDTTFRSIGLGKEVCEALVRAGFDRPAQVQVLASRPLLEGKDVVLAAETGSGKTLAYLGPLASKLLLHRHAARAGAISLQIASYSTTGRSTLLPKCVPSFPEAAKALCNCAASIQTLAVQVVTMANQLIGEDGKPLLHTAWVSSSHPPPQQPPDITVATPAGLIYASDNYGDRFGSAWTRAGIVGRMHYVVFDEADLLLTGGFEKDVRRLREAFQLSDRMREIDAISLELDIDAATYQLLPVHIRKAGIEGGVAAMRAAGLSPKLLQTRASKQRAAPQAEFNWDEAPSLDAAAQPPSRSSTLASNPQPTANEPYWRRQYIFAAATMPAGEVGKSVGADLRRLVPKAVWLNGQMLHRAQSLVTHRWVPVTEDTWAAQLQAAVRVSPGPGPARTVVFAADVAAADSAASVLRDAGLQPLVYHRKLPAEQRATALTAMAQRDKECILVCTDAAARGLDFPQVTHVVQATFASSAIDFLHRVGRTGRAGNTGLVTSLYLPQQTILTEAIKSEIDAGRPVEDTFSRNRSFRNKVKKYGRYVPRGKVVNLL